MKRIRCAACRHVVEQAERMASCVCDPDAPTWVAIQADGRIMSFSHGKYEVLSDD